MKNNKRTRAVLNILLVCRSSPVLFLSDGSILSALFLIREKSLLLIILPQHKLSNGFVIAMSLQHVCGQLSPKLGQSDGFPAGGGSSAVSSCLYHLASVFDRDPPAPH